MDILSYRGPAANGGVSSAMSLVSEKCASSTDLWWYVSDHHFCRFDSHKGERIVHPLNAQSLQEHYSYCNDFLWPVLHDLPELARYSESERISYRGFSSNIANRVTLQRADYGELFVNDYQFSLIPSMVRNNRSHIGVFWHIPWPRVVAPEHLGPIAELALGLLSADSIGFHTEEYCENFFQFIAANLPHADLDFRRKVVTSVVPLSGRRTTQVKVVPLGIDFHHWKGLSDLGEAGPHTIKLRDIPVVLSVDRIDYTKGVKERLAAIEKFFDEHSHWRGRVCFLQYGIRSRSGLGEYDNYWRECKHLAERINGRFGDESWQPLVWEESRGSSRELAAVYRRAEVMLVTPVRDGLNLTAKEYIACQNGRPGVLVLSRGAGVWNELYPHCISVDNLSSEELSHSILLALEMNVAEKRRRLASLQNIVKANTLNLWWKQVSGLEERETRGKCEEPDELLLRSFAS